ncbi:MAG: hypothetical protein RTU92_11235 [Candidatus Thorarchaeota archaeon]
MQKRRQVVLIGLIGLFLMMSFPVEVAAEVTDWSDDFAEDNYDDWTVTAGTYSAAGGVLTATALDPGPAFGCIDHQSNSSFGSWSFDVTIVDDPLEIDRVVVAFMRAERGVWFGSFYYLDWHGNTWYLWKGQGAGGEDIGSFSAPMAWEHHIRVERSRADPNNMYVYHNDTLVISAFTLVPIMDWGYFSFHATVGSSIDNINIVHEPVDSTTTTTDESTTTTSEPSTTPTGTPEPLDTTMILIIAGGGVAVVVIIAIVMKMRS